jgi:hypothetical protein
MSAGTEIDAWYSGKHRRPGGNAQAFMRPDGMPVWISDAFPGICTTWPAPEQQQVLAAACRAASQLDLPTLADSGHEGAGTGVHTPYKQPTDGRQLALDNHTHNTLLRAQRAIGERGFALLKGRWKALRHVTASPAAITDIARATLVPTQFEQGELHDSC